MIHKNQLTRIKWNYLSPRRPSGGNWGKAMNRTGGSPSHRIYDRTLLSPSTMYTMLMGTRADALWSITAKNTDCRTGSLARPFARSLAPLTRGTVNDWIAILSVFFSIFDHSVMRIVHESLRRGCDLGNKK